MLVPSATAKTEPRQPFNLLPSAFYLQKGERSLYLSFDSCRPALTLASSPSLPLLVRLVLLGEIGGGLKQLVRKNCDRNQKRLQLASA